MREGKVDVGATLADPPLPGKDFVADGCADAPPISDFRVVAASEPIPNDCIASGPKLALKMATAISEAFKHMGDSEDGKKLMADAFRVEAWVPVSDKDFDTALRALQASGTPVTAKPADAKPADAKPADAKPADAKPADTKPAAKP